MDCISAGLCACACLSSVCMQAALPCPAMPCHALTAQKLSPAPECRCAERLVLGPGSVSSQGDGDVREVNHIAREMILMCGFSPSLGPVALMEPERLGTPHSDEETAASAPRIGSDVARIALGEIDQVLALRNSQRAASR